MGRSAGGCRAGKRRLALLKQRWRECPRSCCVPLPPAAGIHCQRTAGPMQPLTVSAGGLKALSGLTALQALTLNVDKVRQWALP